MENCQHVFFLRFRDARGIFRLEFVPQNLGDMLSDNSASRVLMCHPCMEHEPASHTGNGFKEEE